MAPDIFRFDFQNYTSGIGLMDEEESQHIIKVLRMKPGEQVVLTNGKGYSALGKILDTKGKLAQVEFDKPFFHQPRKIQLELAIALPKTTDRVDWLISKATEIGVENIVPIITQRSERQKLNAERLTRIAWSAIKQSRQWHLPQIKEGVTLDKYLINNTGNSCFICHQHTPDTPTLLEAVGNLSAGLVKVMVGPEGDFSPEELETAFKAQYRAVSLGMNRLRTETAGAFVCSMINAINKP